MNNQKGVGTHPKITIVPDERWKQETECLQDIFECVRDVLSGHITRPLSNNITIVYHEGQPEVKPYRRNNGDYEVWISARNDHRGQQVYQFSHEYAHILANCLGDPESNHQQWFEESVCVLASIYTLKRLKYYSYLNDHVHKRLNPKEKNIDDIDLLKWYKCNKRCLEALSSWEQTDSTNPYERPYIVSMKLMDIFESHPDDAWNTVRYMNKCPPEKNANFSSYLNAWHRCTPSKHQHIVESIMGRFGEAITALSADDAAHQGTCSNE